MPQCDWFDCDVMSDMRSSVVKMTFEPSGVASSDACRVIQPVGVLDERTRDLATRLLDSPINIEDLYAAKDRMKRGRASGMDGIPIECVLGHCGSIDRDVQTL